MVAVGVALLAALVALALALSGLIAIPGITQASGEIVLQGADEQGLDPFSAAALATPAAAVTPKPATPPVAAAVAAPVSAGSVGIYGGTGDNSRCDPAQMVSFLASNPAKARAWVDALNADPNLRWEGNRLLTTADIPAYIGQLTSLVLLSDTLVTNHGWNGSRATNFQATLQAGTAVLVDRFGVPRARCLCGNPLLPPKPVVSEPKIVGEAWPGFDINVTINIVQVQVVINSFEVVSYPDGGTTIVIPAGLCDPADLSTCVFDWKPEIAVGPTDPNAGQSPDPTPSAAGIDPNQPWLGDPVAPDPALVPVCAPVDPNADLSGLPTSTFRIENQSQRDMHVFYTDPFTCELSYWGALHPGAGDYFASMGIPGIVVVVTSGSSTPYGTWVKGDVDETVVIQ